MIYEEIIQNLLTYKETHPNLISLWCHYLQLKHASYINSLLACSNAIPHFNNNPDIDMNILLSLFLLRDTFNR